MRTQKSGTQNAIVMCSDRLRNVGGESDSSRAAYSLACQCVFVQ